MEDKQNLNRSEQMELFNLMLYRVLLSTQVKEWKEEPTDFVKLSIPEKLKDFLSDLTYPEDTLHRIITTLICKGIENITDEVKSPENIELMIDNIFLDETKNIKE